MPRVRLHPAAESPPPSPHARERPQQRRFGHGAIGQRRGSRSGPLLICRARFPALPETRQREMYGPAVSSMTLWTGPTVRRSQVAPFQRRSSRMPRNSPGGLCRRVLCLLPCPAGLAGKAVTPPVLTIRFASPAASLAPLRAEAPGPHSGFSLPAIPAKRHACSAGGTSVRAAPEIRPLHPPARRPQ